jgi:hypothetical protein
MQASSNHHSPYEHQLMPSFYPPTDSYYMCSPSPPSYHTIYSTPNSSIETHSITSPISQNMGFVSPPSTSYHFYDPYSTPYYPTHYHSMASCYTSPNESMNFDS